MSKRKEDHVSSMSSLFVYVNSSLGICISQAPFKHLMKWIEASRFVNMKLQEIISNKEVESHTFQFQKTHWSLPRHSCNRTQKFIIQEDKYHTSNWSTKPGCTVSKMGRKWFGWCFSSWGMWPFSECYLVVCILYLR